MVMACLAKRNSWPFIWICDPAFIWICDPADSALRVRRPHRVHGTPYTTDSRTPHRASTARAERTGAHRRTTRSTASKQGAQQVVKVRTATPIRRLTQLQLRTPTAPTANCLPTAYPVSLAKHLQRGGCSYIPFNATPPAIDYHNIDVGAGASASTGTGGSTCRAPQKTEKQAHDLRDGGAGAGRCVQGNEVQ
jgi:hypothetical protein